MSEILSIAKQFQFPGFRLFLFLSISFHSQKMADSDLNYIFEFGKALISKAYK